MMKSLFLTTFVSVILTAVVRAADGGANAIATNKTPFWESSISVGLTLTSGNSDTVLTDTAFKTHRNNPTNELTLSLEGAYGENQSVKNTELLHGYGQYNHLFTDRFFGYARADGFHDGIADITYRVTVSPGAGYYFIKSKTTMLAGEAGPGMVFERLDGETRNYLTPRLAERFEHKWNEHTRMWENVEFLQQLDEYDNFLVNAEIGAEAALTRHVSLRTVLQDNFANVPAPGRRDNDLRLISGLTYKF
jgi:putative salt-induced outer membrane protein YdiY